MGIRVPRITVNADFGDDTAFGDLSLLSVGYGLHQAWVYAVMFGTPTIFGTQTYVTGMYGSHASLPFLVSIVVFGLCLLFAGITDQRLLRTYISKKTLAAGAALMSAGTLLLLATPVISGPALEAVSGVMTGIGSAILILFWGVAFARCDSASIVLNSSIAISIAIGVYAIGLHYGPFPIAGILAGIIPLLELAILWNKTPAPYSERNEVPIFKPLPVNHAKFFLRFGIPVFVFGVALGTLRQTSIQYIVPASNVGDQIAMLLAAGFASVVILVTIVALGGGDKWSRYFRPLVPFIAVTLFFLPLSEMSDNTFATMFLVTGYLCFEALMWIFFGELAQRFRLSPIYVFGLGRGMLALAGLAGSLFPIVAANWVHLLPFGEQGVIVIVLLIMVVAYALLPREREIEAIVAPCPLVKAVSLELSDRVRPLGHAAAAGEGAAAPAQPESATVATNAPHPTPRSRPHPNRPRGAPLRCWNSAARDEQTRAKSEKEAAASARSARQWPTPTCFPGARRRSCSSWRRGTTPHTSRKSSTFRKAPRKPTSATSTRRRTSTASRSSCASSSLRIPPNSELAPRRLQRAASAAARKSRVPCTTWVTLRRRVLTIPTRSRGCTAFRPSPPCSSRRKFRLTLAPTETPGAFALSQLHDIPYSYVVNTSRKRFSRALLQIFRPCGNAPNSRDVPTRLFSAPQKRAHYRDESANTSTRENACRACHEVEKLTSTGRISVSGTQPTVGARPRGRNTSPHHGATSARTRPLLRAAPVSLSSAPSSCSRFPIVHALA